jgi:Domain of unknown function (DUF222)/HNH endonuclease
MSVVDLPSVSPTGDDPPVVGPGPQEQAWRAAETAAAEAMGTVNPAVARLVAALVDLLAADGWQGAGIRSPEHWVTWKAGVSHGRAAGLVGIARRVHELPACFARFADGRLGEDAMVRIARRVPAGRDAEIAALAPQLLISQLDRVLAALPDQADGTTDRPQPERSLRLRESRDGWTRGEFCLPADEGALLRLGLTSARDAEFRDRNDLAPATDAGADADADVAAGARAVSWADGLVRMATEAADALDPTFRRTDQRGERNTIVLHLDVDPDGTHGPAQLELGPVVPDHIARYMSCDARIQVMTYHRGRLTGINPAERTVNRATRRYLARRDQGCTHPLCTQKRWLHAHHIQPWQHGGVTKPANLTLLCPSHHRALHAGEFTIDGDPEAGTLRFLDRFGHPIAPPEPIPPGEPPPDGRPPPFTPPLAERLLADSFTWN